MTWEYEEAMRHLESKSVFTSFLDNIAKSHLPHGGLGSLRCLSIQTRSRQLLPVSETLDDSFEKTVKKFIIEHNCCNIFLYTHGYVNMSDFTDTLICIVSMTKW